MLIIGGSRLGKTSSLFNPGIYQSHIDKINFYVKVPCETKY